MMLHHAPRETVCLKPGCKNVDSWQQAHQRVV